MTQALQDFSGWGFETTPDIIVRTAFDPSLYSNIPIAEQVSRVRCPVLVMQGTLDGPMNLAATEALLAARPDFQVTFIEGAGHCPYAREPVHFNLELERFLGQPPTPRWRRAAIRRPKRALFVSSPIGLGHALRDVEIADELRALVPGLEIDWLSQS